MSTALITLDEEVDLLTPPADSWDTALGQSPDAYLSWEQVRSRMPLCGMTPDEYWATLSVEDSAIHWRDLPDDE